MSGHSRVSSPLLWRRIRGLLDVSTSRLPNRMLCVLNSPEVHVSRINIHPEYLDVFVAVGVQQKPMPSNSTRVQNPDNRAFG